MTKKRPPLSQAQHATLCDYCESFIAKGDQWARLPDHTVLCQRCAALTESELDSD